jgi:hypothetical protein
MALSPDGKTLALARVSGDGYFHAYKQRVSLVQAATGKETRTLPEAAGRPRSLFFS